MNFICQQVACAQAARALFTQAILTGSHELVFQFSIERFLKGRVV